MQVKFFQTRIDPDQGIQDQQELNEFMSSVVVKKTATQYVPAEPDYWSIVVFYESSGNARSVSELAPSENDLDESQKELLKALKAWRRDQALAARLPEYMVCTNASLIGLAFAKPGDADALRTVKGIGESKINRYGSDILAVINAF